MTVTHSDYVVTWGPPKVSLRTKCDLRNSIEFFELFLAELERTREHEVAREL